MHGQPPDAQFADVLMPVGQLQRSIPGAAAWCGRLLSGLNVEKLLVFVDLLAVIVCAGTCLAALTLAVAV